MIKKIIDLVRIYKRKIKYKKISYSYSGIDLLIDYIFKDQPVGTYIDIGSQHPISNSNTYLLHKKGWSGVNIDLDIKNVELFNISRPKDINLNYAIADKDGDADLYFYHSSSPINTLSKNVSEYQKAKVKQVKKIRTYKLDTILDNINFQKKIDYMNIDVEGHEEKVLSGFNINKFKPSVISVEYLDLSLNKLKFKNNNIDNLINSNLYQYFKKNDYYFVNWIHGDLIFIHKYFRD